MPGKPFSSSSNKLPEKPSVAAPSATDRAPRAPGRRRSDTAQRVGAPRRNHRPASPPPAPPAPATTPTEAATPAATGRPSRRWSSLLLAFLAVLALGASGLIGYRWWEDSLIYVTTDNAQIDGYMIQVGPLNAGSVTSMRYDVGDRVQLGDVVAQVDVPFPVSATAAGTPRMQYTGALDNLVDVKSTVSGVVVARHANAGDVVPVGQSLLTVVDTSRLWVTANVEETQIRRLQIGQPVDVYVDVLDAHFDGRVVAIRQASAASFSPVPLQNTTANFTKVGQVVPVKIELTRPDTRLSMGTSATVKIRVGE